MSAQQKTARQSRRERYDKYVEDNRLTLQRIEQVIERNVVDNKPGDPNDCYEWPLSEAVVILQHWDEIEAAVRG